jgi:hypothetical protein
VIARARTVNRLRRSRRDDVARDVIGGTRFDRVRWSLMRLAGVLALLALLSVAACSSSAKGTTLPTTDTSRLVPSVNATITPPGSSVPSQDAAFSGVWDGRWGGQLASRLIVEHIDAASATVIYEWGDLAGPYEFKRGSQRTTADVTAPGVIHWFGVADMTFTMSKDRKTISGRYARPDGTSTVTMTKVA